MKEKNGFVFVETMIVVVVLLTILLVVYSSYVGLISVERKRARYDDPQFIYKTYMVGKFLTSLKDQYDNNIIGNKINEINERQSSDNESNIIYISSSDDEMFPKEDDNIENEKQSFFSEVYNNLNIQSIIILSKETMENVNENEISNNLYKYIKTIDTTASSDTDYYLVIMYAEKVNGESCDPNTLLKDEKVRESSCTYYYANLKLTEVS